MKKTKGLIASLLTIAPIVMPAFAFANDCCVKKECCTARPGEPLCGVPEYYPAYAGTDVDCGWDAYAFGEYLWWKPGTLGNTFYATEFFNNPPANNRVNEGYMGQYKSGFRVGVGYIAHDFDDWTFNVDYMRYDNSFHSNKSVAPTSVLTLTGAAFNTNLTNTYNSFSFDYEVEWNVVNLNVQRAFYLGKRLIAKPHFGLKWIGQKLGFKQIATRTTGGTDFEHDTLRNSEIGVDVGGEANLLMCWGFYLLSKIDLALPYNYNQKLHRYTSIFAPVPTVTVVKGKTTGIEVFGMGGLGLGWSNYFWDCSLRANLAISYDMLLLQRTASTPPFLGTLSMGNYMQGLTVTGQIDF
jgi:hypothetical protein